MADKSAIEWTDATWNPFRGCTKVSPGCDHCYAERIVERFHGKGAFANVEIDVDKLDIPLRWRKPRRVFVNSMSDLFHDDIPDAFVAAVFAVMARTPRHTYQILTKRHGRMQSLVSGDLYDLMVRHLSADSDDEEPVPPTGVAWPLPNVHLGVSVENQRWAEIRIPALLGTPTAVRWLSCEPLLGPIDLTRWLPRRFEREQGGYWLYTNKTDIYGNGKTWVAGQSIGWVVVGGESGSGARPMEPAWARSLRDQCVTARVPFLFKQWGEWVPNGWRGIGDTEGISKGRERQVGPKLDEIGHREIIERLGKKRAGRELDGRTWDEYPAVTS